MTEKERTTSEVKLPDTEERAGHGARSAQDDALEQVFEIVSEDEPDAEGGETAAAAREETPASQGPAPARAGGAPDEPADRPADELRALRIERDRLYDAWLRSTADFDNFRKRTERERDEFRHYAVENIVRQMLPVLDNFERALGALPVDVPKGFVDGVTLIYKQIREVLFKQGLASMECKGEVFDPHLHEAVETEMRTGVPHHQILEEVQKGYRLGRRVLRPAMVKVCVRPEPEEDSAQPEPEEDSAQPEDGLVGDPS